MKLIKKLGLIFILSLVILFTNTYVFADVGSFESYDSGSDWGGSDYSSSWDWDDDDDYSYSGGSIGGSGSIIGLFITIIIISIIAASVKGKGHNYNTHVVPMRNRDLYNSRNNQRIVEAQIKTTDPLFNAEVFISWSKDLFIKLQQAWTARDWETIRPFESVELFEQHKSQLQGYIDNNTINVMDRICVNYAMLHSFRVVGDKELLDVVLNSRMKDYIIDATTKEVIQGDKVTERTKTYKLTFVRKAGVKTKESNSTINTTNCPNCGAPTQITSSGKCDYCGSVITTGEHDWVLNNLEPFRG